MSICSFWVPIGQVVDFKQHLSVHSRQKHEDKVTNEEFKDAMKIMLNELKEGDQTKPQTWEEILIENGQMDLYAGIPGAFKLKWANGT